MRYKLFLAAVCEPNSGGAIGGVCQLAVVAEEEIDAVKPEVIKVYEPAKIGNSNFVSNYFTLLKGWERFKEVVEANKDPNPHLTIYTNNSVIINQMIGKHRINISAYSPYANACVRIFSEVWDAISQNVWWEKVENNDISKALMLAKTIIQENAQAGTTPKKTHE